MGSVAAWVCALCLRLGFGVTFASSTIMVGTRPNHHDDKDPRAPEVPSLSPLLVLVLVVVVVLVLVLLFIGEEEEEEKMFKGATTLASSWRTWLTRGVSPV